MLVGPHWKTPALHLYGNVPWLCLRKQAGHYFGNVHSDWLVTAMTTFVEAG